MTTTKIPKRTKVLVFKREGDTFGPVYFQESEHDIFILGKLKEWVTYLEAKKMAKELKLKFKVI